jgi:hypothetical protein
VLIELVLTDILFEDKKDGDPKMYILIRGSIVAVSDSTRVDRAISSL